jgi:hypothetical protein
MLLTYLWLWQFQTIQWFIAGSIIVSASRECVLAGVLIVNGQDKYQILLFWAGAAHVSYAAFLSFDILDNWNINSQCSTSCVRPGHVMVFLIVCFFFVLVCTGWSKYSWYQDSTIFCLSQWLRNVDLFFLAKKIISFNMLYWVIGWDKPFSLNLVFLTFASSLKIKAVCIGIVNMILLILLFSDPERSVNTSSWIFRLSMSRRDEASASSATFFYTFPGRYSDVTSYSSRIKSQRKTRSEVFSFQPLMELFLWSIKTMMGWW